MPDGVEQALADADLALDQLPPESIWIPTALLARGVAHALLGATDRATEDLTAAVETGLAVGSVEEVYVAHAQLALLAAKQGAWGEAGATRTGGAGARRRGGPRRLLVERARARGDARVALHEGRHGGRPRGAGARSPPAAAARPRPSLADHPGRARAHARPSRARRGRRRPHDSHRDRAGARAPPATWAPSSRRRGSCAATWRRPPGRPAPGR